MKAELARVVWCYGHGKLPTSYAAHVRKETFHICLTVGPIQLFISFLVLKSLQFWRLSIEIHNPNCVQQINLSDQQNHMDLKCTKNFGLGMSNGGPSSNTYLCWIIWP